MTRKLLTIAGAITAMSASSSAQAGVVFSDNFDSYAATLNANTANLSPNWTVTGPGNVDIIGSASGFDFLPGNGKYIDLGGSNGKFGLLSTATSFAAGSYLLSFSLAGTQRVPSDVTTVTLGDWSTQIALANMAPFATYSFNITTTGGALTFQDTGDLGNVGNLLDNVVLSAVPEPGTWALMIVGFAVVGAALRRRRVVHTVRWA